MAYELRFGILAIVLVSQVLSLEASAADEDGSFEQRLQFVNRQNILEVGKASKVHALLAIIEEFKGHPNISEAMYSLAHVYENALPSKQIERQPEETLRWLRSASQSAPANSNIRFRAQIDLAGRLPDDAERERILLALVDDRPTELPQRAELLAALIRHFVEKSDISRAQEYTRKLLALQPEVVKSNDDGVVWSTGQFIAMGVGNYAAGINYSNLPADRRRQLLTEFIQEGGMNEVVRDVGTYHMENLLVESDGSKVSEAQRPRSHWRWWVVAVNLLGILLIGCAYVRTLRGAAIPENDAANNGATK